VRTTTPRRNSRASGMLGAGDRLKKPSAKTPAGLVAPSGDALSLYRQKRDPLSTNEPFGTEHKPAPAKTRTGRFVVHLHDATRPHYDLACRSGAR